MSTSPKPKSYDYDKLDQDVKAYQAGDEEAGLRIIEAFNGLLNSYLALLKRGVVDPRSKHMRAFLRLYMRGRRDRRQASTYPFTFKYQFYLNSLVHSICAQFSPYSEEELRAELVTELLAMARRYRNDIGPFFHTYVAKAFHYGAFRRLGRLIRDPAVVSIYSLDRVDLDELAGDDGNTILEDLAVDEEKLFVQGDEELDENWINGYTCSEAFETLTPLERRILVLYYIDRLTIQQIAEKLHLKAHYVSTTKARAIRKLEARRFGNAGQEQPGDIH